VVKNWFLLRWCASIRDSAMVWKVFLKWCGNAVKDLLAEACGHISLLLLNLDLWIIFIVALSSGVQLGDSGKGEVSPWEFASPTRFSCCIISVTVFSLFWFVLIIITIKIYFLLIIIIINIYFILRVSHLDPSILNFRASFDVKFMSFCNITDCFPQMLQKGTGIINFYLAASTFFGFDRSTTAIFVKVIVQFLLLHLWSI